MSMEEALGQALDQAKLPEQSGAAVELARRYARLLDEPVPAGKYRLPLQHLAKAFEHYAATVRMTPTESRGFEAAEVAIVNALAEHSVASDLGPKFLQVLTALNMTLPAQAKPSTEGDSDKPAQPASPHQSARAEAQRLKLINGGANRA